MDLTFSGSFHVAVTILFSLITLGLSAAFAIRPVEKKLRILKPMSWATVFSILASLTAGVGATTLHASLTADAGGPENIATLIMAGLAEAMVAPVLGFVILALSWMLASVGLRRQD